MHASDEGGTIHPPPPRNLIFMIKFSGCSMGSFSPLWQLVPINVFGAESADETEQIERLGMHQMTIESTKYLE